MAAKYALHPGWVKSKTDGDRHYIDARTLAWLYRVRLSDCVVVPWEARPGLERVHQILLERIERMELVHLYPRYSGNYTIPKA